MPSILSVESCLVTIRATWGIESYRPLQAEAIEADLRGRDSLVVMPTGSGKSLCYQAPAVLTNPALTVIVSPLISLMKDQVDALTARGIAAAFLNSSQYHHDQQAVERDVIQGKTCLLYVSPERAMTPSFLALLHRAAVRSIVIDEAHCISQWGHDFRKDYQNLGSLRAVLPSAALHAFTATATPGVRDEIVKSLDLRKPLILVGDFDRPNLTLRVEHRADLDRQLVDFIRGRPGQAGIVYCIRRADTQRRVERLLLSDIDALPYHAGMDDEDRKRVQDAFMAGRADVIVATIAFGMGIDKPDVRWVVHAAMPSSMEVYHQEIGRAGRDGNPAECVVFARSEDGVDWLSLFESRGELPGEILARKAYALGLMYGYCRTKVCRHRQLVEYFGQVAESANCVACGVCLSSERQTGGVS